ncbi:MAG TPA: HAD-IIA family hydrolase [Candidatus Anoxymicrobiaceae bacterium]
MGSLADRYSAFLLDLDGVLYLLNDPIPGSSETVQKLAEAGKGIVFLTNNSSATPAQYVEKLASFDIIALPDQVISSADAARRYLERSCETAGKTAFMIGEDGLRSMLAETGLKVVDGEEARSADFVCVGWDRSFDFDKLKTAVIAIRRGAKYIAMNIDATYPTPEGLWPGAGSIVAAVTTGSGVDPSVMGKPNPNMVWLALEHLGAAASEALMVGDRLDTDIRAGQAAGVDTLLVLTGVSKLEEIESTGIRPTHVRDDLAGLLSE